MYVCVVLYITYMLHVVDLITDQSVHSVPTVVDVYWQYHWTTMVGVSDICDRGTSRL